MNMQGGLAAALSGLALGVVEFGGVAWLVHRMQGRGASTALLWVLRLLFVFATAAWLIVHFKLKFAHFVLGYFLSIFALLAWGILTTMDETNEQELVETPPDKEPKSSPSGDL